MEAEDGDAELSDLPEEDGAAGDAPYVLVSGSSVCIRSAPSRESPLLAIVHEGNRLPYKATDENTGWYRVESPKGGAAYISNRADLTRLVGVDA